MVRDDSYCIVFIPLQQANLLAVRDTFEVDLLWHMSQE